MTEVNDSQKIPNGFVFCYGVGCSKAEECLRCTAVDSVECSRRVFSVVNPAFALKDGDCTDYLTNVPSLLAYGFSKLYDDMPYKIAVKVKTELMNAFGRAEYYRKWRSEHPFTPDDQRMVLQIFARHGLTAPPQYDRTETSLLWQ